MKATLVVVVFSFFLSCISYARGGRQVTLYPEKGALSANSTAGTVSEWDSDILRLS